MGTSNPALLRALASQRSTEASLPRILENTEVLRAGLDIEPAPQPIPSESEEPQWADQ